MKKITYIEENEKLIKQKEIEAEIKAENKILNWIKDQIDELDKDKDIMSPKYLEIKKRVLKDLLDSLK